MTSPLHNLYCGVSGPGVSPKRLKAIGRVQRAYRRYLRKLDKDDTREMTLLESHGVIHPDTHRHERPGVSEIGPGAWMPNADALPHACLCLYCTAYRQAAIEHHRKNATAGKDLFAP